jgi:hypothetical protein
MSEAVTRRVTFIGMDRVPFPFLIISDIGIRPGYEADNDRKKRKRP